MAIAVEVCGTLSLRAAVDGRPLLFVAVTVSYVTSFGLLALVLRDLEVGVAYAVWAGAGTALVAAGGLAIYGDTLTVVKCLWLALIVIGVVGLNVSSSA